MISLEQIRLLEARILKAVELIRSLRDENKTLRRAVNAAQSRMKDLEKLVGDFKSDQKEIEQCILRALENLDRLEEEVTEKKGRRGEDGQGRSEAARDKPKGPPAKEEEAKAEEEAPAEEASTLPPGSAGGAAGEKELDIF